MKELTGSRVMGSSLLLANLALLVGWGMGRVEVEALAEAARREPDQGAIWLRPSEAYGRAGRFAQAEAERTHVLAGLGEER